MRAFCTLQPQYTATVGVHWCARAIIAKKEGARDLLLP